MARRPKAAVAEVLELAGCERGPDVGERGAEPRPEDREVRLDAELGVDCPELDVLDAQLVADLVPVCRRRASERNATWSSS